MFYPLNRGFNISNWMYFSIGKNIHPAFTGPTLRLVRSESFVESMRIGAEGVTYVQGVRMLKHSGKLHMELPTKMGGGMVDIIDDTFSFQYFSIVGGF